MHEYYTTRGIAYGRAKEVAARIVMDLLEDVSSSSEPLTWGQKFDAVKAALDAYYCAASSLDHEVVKGTLDIPA